MFTGYRRFRVQRFRVPFFALRVSQGKQGSAQPLAADVTSLIEEETFKFHMGGYEIQRLWNSEFQIYHKPLNPEPRTSEPLPRRLF